MLSITLQFLMLAGFIALLVVIGRACRRSGWRVRAVFLGWAALFLYTVLCAVILPLAFGGVMDANTIAATFPEGTMVMAALVGGWVYPLIAFGLHRYIERTAH